MLTDEKARSLRIAAIYLVVSAVWILFSDLLLGLFVEDAGTLSRLQTIKGWFFVLVTAWLLYALIVSDLTSIRRSEEELKKSEAKYRSLVENTSDWVWEVDRQGVFTYSNQKVFDLLGYTPQEILGKTPFDFMDEDEIKRMRPIFTEIASQEKPFRLLENTLIHKDGHPVALEFSGVPLFDDQGNLAGYRGVDRDITERKRAEQALMEKEHGIRKAYVDVFSAVTGGRLIIMTPEEVQTALGEPVSSPGKVVSYADLAPARSALREALKQNFDQAGVLNELLLASSEAITNAVKHAESGVYQVFKRDGSVQIMVSDSGPGINFNILPKATLVSGFSTKQSLGLGFDIMLELSDRLLLSTQPGKTTLVLEKRLQPATPEQVEAAG